MDKQIRELIIEYSDLLGFSKTGNFNVVSAIRNLNEGNIYFAGQTDVIDSLLSARDDKDFEEFKNIFESTIEKINSSAFDIDFVEKEYGVSLNEEARVALENNINAVSARVADGTYTPMEGDTLKAQIMDQAFALDPESESRLIQTAEGRLTVFDGYFKGTLFSNIFAQNSNASDIVRFQNYLIQHNIATEEEFAGTKGKFSNVLVDKIQGIMDWADANLNAQEGTAIYNTVMSETPVFFSDVQYQNMDISFERNLFNYAVKEIAKQNIKLEDLQLETALKEEAKKYIPPSPEKLEDMVQAYFVANIGRKATDDELDEWSTELASSYSKSYAQLRSYEYALQNFELKETPIYKRTPGIDPMTERPRTQIEQVGSTFNLDELQGQQPLTPAEIFEGKFEKELGSEMDEFEKGKQIKELQQKIMAAMYGA
jgi:hypothetical protein